MIFSGSRLFSVAASLLTALAISGPVAAKDPTVVYPRGAPQIISDFHSMMGANKKLRSQRHQGIDIAGPNGQPILAVADGKIVDAEVDKCWGPTISIDHGKGIDGKRMIVLYGHLGSFLVNRGQTVKRGQQIGRLGNNHNDFDCIVRVRHLHLQIGRVRRGGNRGTYWGWARFLKDGNRSVNPHLYWADGPGRVTCFKKGRSYPAGTLTYPVPCK